MKIQNKKLSYVCFLFNFEFFLSPSPYPLPRADYYPHLGMCHSERSEESRFYPDLNQRFFTPLRFVQNDKTASTLDPMTCG